MSQQATYARLEEREDEGGAADEIDKVEVQLELPEAPAGQEEPEEPEGKVLNVSVTDGGAALATFQYNCSEDDMDIVDFKSDLEAQLVKVDKERKLRMLIFRGQILQNGKRLSDYKFNHGDTLQLLTWVPEAAAAVAANTVSTAAQSSSTASSSAGGAPARADFSIEMPQHPFAFAAVTAQSMALQEEVERWSARVKVWTCMLLLIYSFKLLVGMSQSLEANQQHSSELAFSFLGFWVAYIGLRAATRLNFSLARGYYYGQMTVAMCNLFLMAIRDPSVVPNGKSPDGTQKEISPNVLYISFAINVIFWAYIVYGAFRFQRALWLWLQDGAPEHVLEAQEEV